MAWFELKAWIAYKRIVIIYNEKNVTLQDFLPNPDWLEVGHVMWPVSRTSINY
jgi:hypothetical protein